MNFSMGRIVSFNHAKGSGFIVSKEGVRFYFHTSRFCRLFNSKMGIDLSPISSPIGGFEEGMEVVFTSSPRKEEQALLPFTPVDAFCTITDYNRIFGQESLAKRSAAKLRLTKDPAESKYQFKQRVKAESGASYYQA